MNIGIKVGDLMTRNFIRADPEMDLAKCAKRMIKKRVGSLVITEGDVLRGILTEKDIVYAVVKKSGGRACCQSVDKLFQSWKTDSYRIFECNAQE